MVRIARGVVTPLLMTAVLVTACGQGGPTAGGETRAVQHVLGTANVPTEPERVAVLWRPTLSAVVQLGLRPVAAMGEATADDKGLTPYVPEGYPLQDLQIVASTREVNFEQLAAARPDLILSTEAVVDSRSMYDKLTLVAPTVVLPWTGTESWRDHLTEVADALNLRAKADQIVRQYQDRVAEVRAKLGDQTQVSLVRIQTADEIRVETPRSFPGQVLADAGIARPPNQTTADPDRDYISLSLERIPEAAGDAIIVMHASNKADAWESVAKNPLWTQLPAAVANRVVTVDYDHWGASNYLGAHHILDDLEKMAATIA